ncbi:hypothetical protein HZS_4203 [Henneguya salminicola]|nr:hypothetical protein HZS_4203 [Henneguya salminicola]
MSGAIFGGDEIDAIVLDVGTFTTRAGFAGQDRPEVHIDIPTFMGYRNNGEFLSSYFNYIIKAIQNTQIICAGLIE